MWSILSSVFSYGRLASRVGMQGKCSNKRVFPQRKSRTGGIQTPFKIFLAEGMGSLMILQRGYKIQGWVWFVEPGREA